MIPFEIEYIRPTSIEEAVAAYTTSIADGKTVRYLSGGTELVTMARDGKLRFDTLIDLKRIPETTECDPDAGRYGACLRLTEVAQTARKTETGSLIAKAARGIADHTTRNSITLGGNVCGMLPYREAILPFLVFEGSADVAGAAGRRSVNLKDFSNRLRLETGEFLVSLNVNPAWERSAIFYQRRTRDARVDYPLLTLCMANNGDRTRMAVTGAFAAPVHSEIVNDAPAGNGSTAERARAAVEAFGKPRRDMRGSTEYRAALLQLAVEQGLDSVGGAS